MILGKQKVGLGKTKNIKKQTFPQAEARILTSKLFALSSNDFTRTPQTLLA
jgi:hypothetical protein